MSEFKVVSMEPTAEMVEAAQDAYMPFGDMDIALRMALLAAPAAQEEPVAWLWVKGAYRTVVAKDFADELIEDGEAVAPLYAAPQPAEQQPDVSALVEALDVALNGSRIDDLNRDNDDLWRTCYPVLNDRQRKIFEAHIKRLETALAAHRKQGGE